MLIYKVPNAAEHLYLLNHFAVLLARVKGFKCE